MNACCHELKRLRSSKSQPRHLAGKRTRQWCWDLSWEVRMPTLIAKRSAASSFRHLLCPIFSRGLLLQPGKIPVRCRHSDLSRRLRCSSREVARRLRTESVGITGRSEADLRPPDDQHAHPAMAAFQRGARQPMPDPPSHNSTLRDDSLLSVREDIRDLFNLTTSHMSTYMVIGTLFLGFSVSFIWYCPTFPGHPAWLKLLWVNTSAGALCYSFLAVWLAMHGAIAAQSASVQLLTRAIRPPYPTAMELQRVQHQLAQYEAAPSKFFRPPNLLGQERQGQDVPHAAHDPHNLTLQSTVNSTTSAAQVPRQGIFKGTHSRIVCTCSSPSEAFRFRMP